MAQLSGKLTKRQPGMDLPLQEQLRNEQWRRLINGAGPGDLEALKTAALMILSYAETSRCFALQQAQSLLPKQQNAPAAETAEAP
jgi:hypothetical protein